MASTYSMLSVNRAFSNVGSIRNDGNFPGRATNFLYSIGLPKGVEETWKKKEFALLKYP